MSSPSFSFIKPTHTHSHPPYRKEVPDGSQDFQRVLDTILLDDDIQNNEYCDNNQKEDERDDLIEESEQYYNFVRVDDEDSRNLVSTLQGSYSTNVSQVSDFRRKHLIYCQDNDEQQCSNNNNNNSHSNYDGNNNNNISCELDQCKKLHSRNTSSLSLRSLATTATTTTATRPLSGAVSPSNVITTVFDCNGDLVYSSNSAADDEDDKETLPGPYDDVEGVDVSCVKFPDIHRRDRGTSCRSTVVAAAAAASQRRRSNSLDVVAMGANCSSGIYDHRDWHDIILKEGGQSDKKVRKRGKPVRKKHLNLNKDNCCVVTAQLCTCKHRISDSSPDPVSEPIPIPGTDQHDDQGGITKPKEENGLEFNSIDKLGNNSPPPPSGGSPSARSVSPNQGRLSKMLGLKILSSSSSSSSPKADVSPHRLLVRRSYSPKSRASSMEEMIRQNNDSVYRQRSYSWSNGKLNTKPTIKVTSTSASSSFIQSPILSPVANHTAIAPIRYSSSSPNTSPRTAADKAKVKEKMQTQDGNRSSPTGSNNNSAHDQSCPLFKLASSSSSSNKDRLSANRSYEDDDEMDSITPIVRRRAVSESQASRSRQKARRAAANAAAGSAPQDGDHLRVHWADESGTSSLSTSVFLSSIRPRSYSHGGVCNTPHRPILKKVIIS